MLLSYMGNSQNIIIPPKLDYNNRNELYFGMTTGFNKNGPYLVGPSLLLKDKNDRIYSMGVFMVGDPTRNIKWYDGLTVGGSIYWRIRFRKN